MPDSSDIDAALVAKLRADVTLAALVPDGVYFDQAPPKSQRFVIVSLATEEDAQMQGSPIAFEDGLYLVKAVMLTKAGGNIKAAAARIHEVLQNTTLTATGYTPMAMFRESRIRYTEVDEEDNSLRWLHRGGHYRVVMST